MSERTLHARSTQNPTFGTEEQETRLHVHVPSNARAKPSQKNRELHTVERPCKTDSVTLLAILYQPAYGSLTVGQISRRVGASHTEEKRQEVWPLKNTCTLQASTYVSLTASNR